MSEPIHIIGSGASGLLLARALARYKVAETTQIFIHNPKGNHIPVGRWCFWPLKAHPYEHLVSKKWLFGHYVYAQIVFADFYQNMREWLLSQPNITLVEEAISEDQLAGLSREAAYIFDSRPPEAAPKMWQHFMGWHIHTDDEIFTDNDFTLMEFNSPATDQDIAFTYILPLSRKDALIEDTHLSQEIFSQNIYEERLRHGIPQKWPHIKHYEIQEIEHGAIPLYLNPPQSARHNVYPIGARAGAIRAATGYGFWHMMQHSEQIASALARGQKLPPADPIQPITRWMDKIFMQVLQNTPEKAPAYFQALFQKVSEDKIARFLMDGASWHDRLTIMRALPVGPFLEAAWKNS